MGDLRLVISHDMHRLRLIWETRNSVAAVLADGVRLHVLAQQLQVVGLGQPLLGALTSVKAVFLWRVTGVHMFGLASFLLRFSELVFELNIA